MLVETTKGARRPRLPLARSPISRLVIPNWTLAGNTLTLSTARRVPPSQRPSRSTLRSRSESTACSARSRSPCASIAVAVAPGGVRAARQAQIEQVAGPWPRSAGAVAAGGPRAPAGSGAGGHRRWRARAPGHRPGERQLDGDHQLEVADQGVGLGVRPVDRGQQMLGALGDRLLEQRDRRGRCAAAIISRISWRTAGLAIEVEAQQRAGRPLQGQKRAQALLGAVVTAGQRPAGEAEGDALVVAQEQMPVRARAPSGAAGCRPGAWRGGAS